MPRLSLWNSGRKANDYKFFDRVISEYFGVGGTAVFVHKYLGPYDQGDDSVYTPPSPTDPTAVAINERSVQDVLFLENRDRKYSNIVYEMRGIYNVGDTDFDLRQFGLFLQNDTLFIEFHYNDMINLIGRKLISGDVLELPHQRDENVLDVNSPAVNKFYLVEDANRASDGYSASWWPHIWRVKVSPLVATQEYQDILDKQATDPFGLPAGTVGELMSTMASDLGLNAEIIESAVQSVSARYFESRQYYVVPGSQTDGTFPAVFTGDGTPPNGAALLGSGSSFPLSADSGSYWLRTDYSPATLFQLTDQRWVMQEVDWRQSDWSVAHRLLKNFINNSATTTLADGTTINQKVNLSVAIKPRADF